MTKPDTVLHRGPVVVLVAAGFAAVCLLLGGMLGNAVSGSVLAIIEPLGRSASAFAARDDAVPEEVRSVLLDRHRLLLRARLAGGDIVVARSRTSTMVAVALSGVRPAPGERVGFTLDCDGEHRFIDLGLVSTKFTDGPHVEGWENSFALNAPETCPVLVAYLLDDQGEVVAYTDFHIGSEVAPIGVLAQGWR